MERTAVPFNDLERSIHQMPSTSPGTGTSYELSHLIYLVGGIQARVDIT